MCPTPVSDENHAAAGQKTMHGALGCLHLPSGMWKVCRCVVSPGQPRGLVSQDSCVDINSRPRSRPVRITRARDTESDPR